MSMGHEFERTSQPDTPEERVFKAVARKLTEIRVAIDQKIADFGASIDPSVHPENATEEDTAKVAEK